MAEQDPFYLKQNRGFGKTEEKDDLLHPEQNKHIKDDSLTETQWFGFSVPEAEIYAYAYLWHHPNLGVVTGGLWAGSGIRLYKAQSELNDFRAYMSDSVLKDDLHDYRLDNGYGVKILEPLKRFHLTYSDPERENEVDLIHEAISSPMMYNDECHFEQAMHVTGTLLLRGKHYDVDCYNVRDRSWGKLRKEENLPLPPLSWMTGVFNEKFSFSCTVFDQASNNPELRDQPFVLPEEKTLIAGWMSRDGKDSPIVYASKRVERDPYTLVAKKIELLAKDELGRSMQACGTLISSCPWDWCNAIASISLMRWECDGLVSYGNCQECLWNDYWLYMTKFKV